MLPQIPLTDRVGLMARDPDVLEKVTYAVCEPGTLSPMAHERSSTGGSGSRKWIIRLPPAECSVSGMSLDGIVPALGAELQYLPLHELIGTGPEPVDDKRLKNYDDGLSLVNQTYVAAALLYTYPVSEEVSNCICHWSCKQQTTVKQAFITTWTDICRETYDSVLKHLHTSKVPEAWRSEYDFYREQDAEQSAKDLRHNSSVFSSFGEHFKNCIVGQGEFAPGTSPDGNESQTPAGSRDAGNKGKGEGEGEGEGEDEASKSYMRVLESAT
jgi:hypothetical protein